MGLGAEGERRALCSARARAGGSLLELTVPFS